MRALLLISAIATLSWTANGQHLPYGLRLTKVKTELLTQTQDLDSLILIDKANYWSEDMKISGLGFKQNEVYKLSIYYEPDSSSTYDMRIRRIERHRIVNDPIGSHPGKVKLQSIQNLNSDSLNLKPSWSISDQNEWTILFCKKQDVVIRQSYAPESYQSILPTGDRQLFMDLFNRLDKLINNQTLK